MSTLEDEAVVEDEQFLEKIAQRNQQLSLFNQENDLLDGYLHHSNVCILCCTVLHCSVFRCRRLATLQHMFYISLFMHYLLYHCMLVSFRPNREEMVRPVCDYLIQYSKKS